VLAWMSDKREEFDNRPQVLAWMSDKREEFDNPTATRQPTRQKSA